MKSDTFGIYILFYFMKYKICILADFEEWKVSLSGAGGAAGTALSQGSLKTQL